MVSIGKLMIDWWFEANIKFDATADYVVWRMGFMIQSLSGVNTNLYECIFCISFHRCQIRICISSELESSGNQ